MNGGSGFARVGIALTLAACGFGAPASGSAGLSTSTSAPASGPGDTSQMPAKVPLRGRYAPRDECGDVPGAADFRRELTRLVSVNDAGGIAALASRDVMLGFGGDDGRIRLLEKLEDPRDGLMGELAKLLTLGCAVDADGDLVMPWYFAQDFGEIDAYAAMMVTGEDVPAYTVPDPRSQIDRRLSWELVALGSGFSPDDAFQRVELPGGGRGFIATARLRSLLDYRLVASREGRDWQITAILAGD
ncbi:MAG TPA: hypothetical protein VJM34_06485 [Novosphingobium sp.]|nr:hypothetical protein [Novosphingobium sp.]